MTDRQEAQKIISRFGISNYDLTEEEVQMVLEAEWNGDDPIAPLLQKWEDEQR